MKNKKLGLILSIIAIAGILASLSILFIIQPCCTLFMETYHQMLIILIPIFILVLTVGFYLYFQKETKKFSKIRIFKEILTDDEKKIIDILKKKQDITQADLRRELMMSKAKLSMLLEKMQQRNLVKKIKKGKTNLVLLVKRI